MWACDPGVTSAILNSYEATGPLFVQTLQTFIAAHCALVGDHLWPEDAVDAVTKDPYYDFIVVGAGSAGAVVANRLSEVSQWKVLLVEAGGNPTLATELPQLFYSNTGGSTDWGYLAEPQEGASRAFKGGQCLWPRGKVLGGCSSINAMFYVRGNKEDYDDWERNGNYGWGFNDVLEYFKKSENYSNFLTQENQKYHSKGGYLNVQRAEVHEYERGFLDALNEIGLKTVEDINGPSQMGATTAFVTIKGGVRHSTARAFLSPIKNRTNLHVLKNTLATKIIFEHNTNIVKGVILRRHNKDLIVNVKKEIVMSAGAINTPQLLLLSGIGPKSHLNKFNIEVKADLSVGDNLQDHLFVPIIFTMPGDINATSLSNIFSILADGIIKNKGPLSDMSPHRVIAFINTTDLTVNTPDIQYHFVTYNPKSSDFIDVFEKLKVNYKVYKEYKELNENHSILLVFTTLLSPKSRGNITLKSIDPNVHPIINANYFTNIKDLETIVRGVKYISRLNNTKTFRKWDLTLKWLEFDRCKDYELNSDDYIACMAREMTFTLYHPTGTAKMGPSSDITAVLDPELRVRKVEKLRVVDASVMPNIVRGNTNAPTIMIGEKGADMIKHYWLHQHSEL